MSVILAYIPVLHKGYLNLFLDNTEAKSLYILSDEVAAEFTPLHKEIRALDQNHIVSAIKSWNLFGEVKVADDSTLKELAQQEVIIPDEIVTNEVAKKYGLSHVKRSPIFLRWDKQSATAEQAPTADATVSSDEAAQKFMQRAVAEGQKSSDWWRHVGAVAVVDGKVLGIAHNTHLPSEQQPYAEGDPRAHFHKGDHIELTTAIHAEAKLIANAAATGTSLKGAELFVTDFPCPVCAKSITFSGIAKVYFAKGYAMLDGERVLKTAGIEIIRVNV